MSPPLSGRTIVVTRPAAQASGLVDAIVGAGGLAFVFPLLEIEPGDPQRVLDAAAPSLDRAALAVFVSPNAVRHGLRALLAQRAWPPALVPAAVGQGTARALVEAGLADVVAPAEGFDSEALLALPALSAARVAGREVLLFKGEGGRDLLAETLRARGARVVPVVCYRRRPPGRSPSELFELLDAGRVDAIVVTSSEAMANLGQLFGEGRREQLGRQLVVATHPRIADAARRLGCRRVLETSPGDAAVAAALGTYNWPPAPTNA